MLRHNLTDAPAWFTACAADNTRDFWAANKDAYDEQVRQPFLELLRDAGEDVGAWRVYRPHRDTRFSPDGGPLKTFLGALHVDARGTGRYVQVDARGLLASSGLPYLAPDQLSRWRSAVASPAGDALSAAVDSARAAGAAIKSGYPEPLKRVPKGYDADHPRATWLRWKGIEAYRRRHDLTVDPSSWLLDTWAAGRDLCEWLAAEVGASTMQRPQ
jgi:uncharacterized protein (TIGR02453 family)